MKRFTVSALILLVFCSFHFTANAQSADIYAQVTDVEYVRNVPLYSITAENGTVTKAFASDGITLTQGQWGDFTVEYAPSNLSSAYNYITAFTLMPEAGQEVGYLYNSALKQTALGDTDVLVLIDGDAKKLNLKKVSINGQDYIDIGENNDTANAVANILKNYRGCISYTVDSNKYITELDFVTEAKKAYTDIEYNNGFNDLEYNITADTTVVYIRIIENPNSTSHENIFTQFQNGVSYSLDIMSYDRDKNARFVIVKAASETKFGILKTKNNFGIVIESDGNEHSYDKPSGQLAYPSSDDDVTVVQFDYNHLSEEASDITFISGSHFDNYEYDESANTFGGTSAANTTLMSVSLSDFGEVTAEILKPNENLLYSGSLYISTNGEKIAVISKRSEKVGLPHIEFDAYESKTDSSCFCVSAAYNKNGYTGNGKIYLAVYKNSCLDRVFTYDLQNEGASEGDDYAIFQYVPYETGFDWRNYLVVGYVWSDNLLPIYPKQSLTVDYR